MKKEVVIIYQINIDYLIIINWRLVFLDEEMIQQDFIDVRILS